jgi:hypothetical protein
VQLVAEVIGEAVVRVRGDTSGFKQSTQSGVVGGMKEIALTAAKTFGLVFGAEKVFHFGEDAIHEASLTQKATENIKAQFGESADKVLEFSDHTAAAFGVTKHSTEDFASSIGLVTTNLGIGQKQGATMAIGLQKLAGSIGQIKGQDPSGYFDKLKLALLGNTRGLKQMGISLDSTTISQYALDHGIVKSTVDHAKVAAALEKSKAAQKTYTDAVKADGKNSATAHSALIKMNLAHDAYKKELEGTVGKLTAAQKAQAVYGLATQHLGDYMKQAKAHSSDWANEQLKLKAELSDVQEEIGAALLPALAALGSLLLTYLIPSLKAVAAGFKAVLSAIPPDVLKGIALGIGVVASAWLVYTVAQYAAAGALMAMNAAFAISPIGLVIIGVIALVAALFVLYERVGVVHSIVQSVFGFLQTFVPAALNVIKTAAVAVFSFIRSFITVSVTVIKGVIQVAMALIQGDWSRAWNLIKNAVSTVFGLILGVLRSALGFLVPVAKQIGSAILDAVVGEVKKLPGQVWDLIKKIPGALGDMGSLLKNAGVQLITGFIGGITSKIGDVKDTLTGLASDAVSWKGPPAKDKVLLRPAGQLMMQGFVRGITGEIPGIRSLLTGLTGEIPGLMGAGLARRGASPAISAPSTPIGGRPLGGGGITITGPVTVQPRDPVDFMRRLNMAAAAAR